MDEDYPPLHYTVVSIHREDDAVAQIMWPIAGLPRFGETFQWNDELFCVVDTIWELRNVSNKNIPGEPVATTLEYHIFLGDDEEEWEEVHV